MIYLIFFILLTKHFVVDFLWQPEFEWRNKGTFLHPGGIQHAFKHAAATILTIGTLVAFGGLSPTVLLWSALAEFVLHYAIDYAKMNINRVKGWDANRNPEFWYLTGLDQYLHGLTYLGITVALTV